MTGALFLHVNECIAANAQSAKRPEQRPDSFFGKEVLPAENTATWGNMVVKYIPQAQGLRFIQLECSTGRKYVTSFIFFQSSFRVIRCPQSFLKGLGHAILGNFV